MLDGRPIVFFFCCFDLIYFPGIFPGSGAARGGGREGEAPEGEGGGTGAAQEGQAREGGNEEGQETQEAAAAVAQGRPGRRRRWVAKLTHARPTCRGWRQRRWCLFEVVCTEYVNF